ncbi:nicotinate-nucleotide--dimethylbenzimidazole phosphoribosyltransferase [Petrocella sp. FN5]|uniref:nicotinate-nucleotide--dimethylbenzimidazole phosphoribosyltransferase n=1 Tax=Petrocella sp. FN5 TaxID=3032002 RepID=UPI0023DBDDF2|nr:nicotinate-nucleotide--dimethylbenzimidazole phosphoribosyltransferase [Petrocella sp. FN5]MDF1617509.1 nicotinate-nucleotide--dimethylbenzimidazole phosphoribosyltransferase [Petrocella sp. FN5]
MGLLDRILIEIRGLNEPVMLEAQKRMDSLAKPLGSLGTLEKIAIQIAGITGHVKNEIHKKCTIIMAADHGICAEGVSCAPQEVTAIQSLNMLKGITGICAISKVNNADIRVVDIGVMSDIDGLNLVKKKIRYGTNNFLKGPAMEGEEVIKAIEIGIEMVKDLVKEGYNLIGTGEMGIGNTTCSSAVFMALTGSSANHSVGKGGGITEEAFEHKKSVIEEAIRLNQPNSSDPIDVLTKVGGLDLAGMVGCFLGAAYYRVPIVIDGFISATAAFVAYKINPLVKDFLIPSHCSLEPGYMCIMKKMGLNPMLYLEMRLGEGTGCPIAFHIIETGLSVMNNMATFEEATIISDYLVDIR